MKLWAMVKRKQRIVKDYVYSSDVLLPVDEADLLELLLPACEALDLSRPLVLNKHVSDFNTFGRCVFLPSDFMESVSFDKFELEMFKNPSNSIQE